MTRVAVVGGGASGASAVAHLLRGCRGAGLRDVAITVFEKDTRRPWWGGAAYGTCAAYHIINVPCAGMHLLEEDTNSIMEWLAVQRARGTVDKKWGTTDMHIPRDLIQRYFEETLAKEEAAAAAHAAVTRVRREVLSITRAAADGAGKYLLTSVPVEADGQGDPAATTDGYDFVVMCTGNFPPENIPCEGGDVVFATSTRYHKDPWRLFREDRAIPRGATVGILGSRLSAIDTLQCLSRRGHTGQIHVFSRKGLYPRENHGEDYPPAFAFQDKVLEGRDLKEATMSDVVQNGTGRRGDGAKLSLEDVHRVWSNLIAQCDAAEKDGAIWQSVVDGLRPYHNKLWLSMDTAQRKLFLTKYRDEFEIRRHRVAPNALKNLAPFLKDVPHHAGGVKAVASAGADAPITLTLADGKAVTVDYLINCTGPQIDFRHTAPSRLFAQLAKDGLITPEGTGIGLLVDPATGRALAPDLRPADAFFLMGPIRRGTEWETIAYKEIRRQGHEVARAIIHALKPAAKL